MAERLRIGIGSAPIGGPAALLPKLPKAAGLLADDWRHNDPRYSEENWDANLRIVDAIQAVADRHRASLAQVALAWLLAQGDDLAPIPGVKRRATLEDSAAAVEVELSGEDLAELEAVRVAAGDRYNAAGMARVKL